MYRKLCGIGIFTVGSVSVSVDIENNEVTNYRYRNALNRRFGIGIGSIEKK